MDIEAAAEQRSVEQAGTSLPFPRAWWGRVLYGLYITILPAFAFWGTELVKPEWQSGDLSDYIILLLFPEASMLFFLLLAYSVICYVFLLISPLRDPHYFFIRLGIYTSVLLTLQYSILAGAYLLSESTNPSFLLLWIFPVFYFVIYRWAVAKWTARRVNNILFILVAVVLLIAVVIFTPNILAFALIVLTVAAPFWCFLIALRAAIWLFKNYETRFVPAHWLSLTAWLGAYIAAWRFNILKMYELYAQLPPTPPPDCYIATAAAHGHPTFVRARIIRQGDGTVMCVNAQLQRLKCAELAVLAVNPYLHARLRRIYDRLGQPLARNIRNPFAADLAYLLLKPLECLAAFILKLVIPEIDAISKKMYSYH